MKTKSVLVASLMALAIAMPAWGDTLVLRNGRTLSGTLTGASRNTVSFQDRTGRTYRYSVREVEGVQFGDGPYNSGNYGRPDNGGHDNQGYGNDRGNGQGNDQGNDRANERANDRGNDQGNRNQDRREYGQSRMERVVLPVGTEVAVRTNERIDSRDVVEGETFSAQIEEDILDTDGSVAIPRGSDARLVTRRVESNGDITLDVESITVSGRRYRVSTANEELQNRREGVGGNERTGRFVGGGAVLGAIVGAIAGGGRGAAIGAASGAGAGAAAQIVTRGREVHVPAESVIRFRLDNALRLHLWS